MQWPLILMFIIGQVEHVKEHRIIGREVLLCCPVGTLRRGLIMSVAHWGKLGRGYHVCRPVGNSGRGLSCLSPTGHLSKGAIKSVAHWAPLEGGYHVCRPLGTSGRGLSCLSPTGHLRIGRGLPCLSLSYDILSFCVDFRLFPRTCMKESN